MTDIRCPLYPRNVGDLAEVADGCGHAAVIALPLSAVGTTGFALPQRKS